mgnify:FL=1
MVMWKDSETVVDYLKFDYIIDAVTKIVLDEGLSPSSIGLYGDWGSGKSSLMKMIEQKLTQRGDKSILCVRFNGWLFEGYEDAKTALCGTILEKIKEKETIDSKIKEKVKLLLDKVDVQKILGKGIRYGLDYFLTGGVLGLTEISISQITKALKSKAGALSEDEITDVLRSFKTESNIRKDIKNFQKEFADILEDTKIKHLVVFVDELDRCTPETILDVIEAIRLFLFAKGTSFVIGADQRLIEYAIRTKYKDVVGNNLDIGKEYMEKVIQYPVNIPALDENEVEKYISCLLLEKKLQKDEFPKILSYIRHLKPYDKLIYTSLSEENSDLADKCRDSLYLSEQISSVLAKQINGNPRQCKRFLNTLFMRLDMAKTRGVELKQEVMAKLMLIEYFYGTFYKLVIDSSNKEELAKFEKGKETTVFKDYSNDEWLKKWNEIDCKLSEEDLRDYYYYSSSRFAYNQSVVSSISPTARICLDKLLDKTEIHRTEAVDQLKELSLAEHKNIAKVLYEKMKKEDKIDNDLFKSYLKVISRKDMMAEALSQLKSIPVQFYSKAQIAMLDAITIFISDEEKTELEKYFGYEFGKQQNIINRLKKK